MLVILMIVPAMIRREADNPDLRVPTRAKSQRLTVRSTNPTPHTRSTRESSIPESSSLAGSSGSASIGLRTAAELEIRNSVAQWREVQDAGARVDDVIADPRQGVAVVTFSVAGGMRLTKGSVMTAAGAVARAAFVAHREVNFVTARCLVTGVALSMTQVVFVGDVSRASIDSLGDKPTTEQYESVFTDPWWNPQIK